MVTDKVEATPTSPTIQYHDEAEAEREQDAAQAAGEGGNPLAFPTRTATTTAIMMIQYRMRWQLSGRQLHRSNTKRSSPM